MKRKRGHKKGKPKGAPVVSKNEVSINLVSANTEDNSGLDGFGNDNKYESGMEVDTPSSTGTDQPYNVASINPDGSIDKAMGKSVGRVKVKLRTSKMLESQHTSSDAPTHSDTDKSSQQMGFERQGVGVERMEDSANSLPIGVSGNPAKKAGSIKIKSSMILGNPSVYQSGGSAAVAQGESPHQKELKIPHQDAQFSKQELDDCLTNMKRKRGHKKGKPKGAPVVSKNEVSINLVSANTEDNSGLDGFGNDNKYESGMEVDTPSSTGTDQPYNVASINPDGSIDKAMGKSVGRVKVKLRTSKMLESQHTSSDAPTHSDTDKSSQQMGFERQGVGVERMEDSANSLPIGVSGNPAKKAGSIKIKSSMILGNPSVYQSGGSAAVAQGESPHQKELKIPHQDAQFRAESIQVEDVSVSSQGKVHVKGSQPKQKTGKRHGRRHKNDCLCAICVLKRRRREREENARLAKGHIGATDNNYTEETQQEEGQHVESPSAEDSSSNDESLDPDAEAEKEDMLMRQEAKTAADQQQKHKELQEKHKKSKVCKNLELENPMLLDLCGILFPDNHKSVWGGPHSLNQHHRSARTSSIHAAIATFMK
ncbi:hypothetical protein CFP56_033757 [Quercus suber]|uniref:Uncharacterized protein n=1 Tax=Quercus suber TaxID=58331 RepID=A0AAW0LU86_QUESU